MARSHLARLLGFGLPLMSLVPLAYGADETADAARKAKAAVEFADALAPEKGEGHARAFRLGLEAAYAPAESRGSKSRGRTAAGAGVESDPRYQQNLTKMTGPGSKKIWGGQRTAKGTFPDVVAVRGGGGICSGTLVAPRVVLTAAHCHCGGVTETVTFGDSTGDAAARVVPVLRSEAWIRCDQHEREGDLAILHLKEDAPVAPRALAPTAWIDVATEVHVVGFGRTEDPLAEPVGIKREVDVPIATPHCAGEVAQPAGPVSDSVYYDCRSRRELVAGSPLLDRDSCNGDSGGPVFVRGPDDKLYLAAATSRAVVRFGLRPCGDGGIYARADGDGLAWMKTKGVSVTVGGPPAAVESFQRGAKLLARTTQATPAGDAAASARARTNAWVRSHAEKAVPGTIRARPDGRFVLVPDSEPDLAISLANSRALSSTVVGLPVRVKLESSEEGVVARSISLEAVAEWSDGARSTGTHQGVDKVAADLRQASERSFRSGGMGPGEALSELLASSQALERELANALVSLPADRAQERTVLRENLKKARATSKALYARSDVYRPEAYRRIFDNSRGTVAIAVRGVDRPYCSGFLVATDAILTARHCLLVDPELPDEFDASELEVRFNYERDLAGTSQKVDTYPVKEIQRKGEPVFSGGPDLDFALLRLDRNTNGKVASDAWPVQCLSKMPLRRDHPVYVIGHPQGDTKSVHDNAFVYFPFRATGHEFNHLKALVEAELAGPPPDPKEREQLQQFTDSYRKRTIIGGVDIYENFSKRWNLQPTVATDADTFKGNSGSAVYSRLHHRVVGILFAGEYDAAMPWIPGWRAHEAVLPITQVMDQLDAVLPAWKQLGKRCVDN